jgi:hypothetical protein
VLSRLFWVLGRILLLVVLVGGVALLGFGVSLCVDAYRAGSSEDVAALVNGVFGGGAVIVGFLVTAAAGAVAYRVARPRKR